MVRRIERFEIFEATGFESPVRRVPALEESEVDVVGIEFRAVDARELRFSTHVDPTPAAHAGSVDHDRIQRRDGFDLVRPRHFGDGSHHRHRPSGENSVDDVRLKAGNEPFGYKPA